MKKIFYRGQKWVGRDERAKVVIGTPTVSPYRYSTSKVDRHRYSVVISKSTELLSATRYFFDFNEILNYVMAGKIKQAVTTARILSKAGDLENW